MTGKQTLFGQELKKLRKEAGYTQEELGKRAGISASYVSQLETGNKEPTDKVITKLSGPLDIPENHLLLTVGKIKMDLVSTLATDLKEAPEILSALSDQEWERLLTDLATIKVKASIHTK